MADVHARCINWRQALQARRSRGRRPDRPGRGGARARGLAPVLRRVLGARHRRRDDPGRLFTALFAAGVVVVATSNVAPDDLYKDGLNRALFLPFIALIKERLDIVELDARTDYRLEKLTRAPVYYSPARREGGRRARRGVPAADRPCQRASRLGSSSSAAISTSRRRSTASRGSISTLSAGGRSARPTISRSRSASTPSSSTDFPRLAPTSATRPSGSSSSSTRSTTCASN